MCVCVCVCVCVLYCVFICVVRQVGCLRRKLICVFPIFHLPCLILDGDDGDGGDGGEDGD